MTELDLFAFIIALGSAIALIITSAVQNARLTRSRNYWRTAYHDRERALLERESESR